MSSLRRVLSSRANGARSKGPKTEKGKRRSVYNATRHGLLAQCLVLDNESRSGFDDLVAQYLARLAPADGLEVGMVEEMVAAFWRMRRAWAIENRLLDNALQNHPDAGEIDRIAAAFSELAQSGQLNLLHRYETRLHCMFQRALHNLLLLRTAAIPNEPSPISGHPGPPAELPALPPSPEEPVGAPLERGSVVVSRL